MSNKSKSSKTSSSPRAPSTGYDAMASKTMGNALRCCGAEQTQASSVSSNSAEQTCTSIHNPFDTNRHEGECDMEFQFKAEVCEVESFTPKKPFEYPDMPEIKCPLGEPFADVGVDKPLYINPETGEIVVDELASRHQFQYSPCFESWQQKGYQRDR